MHDSRCPTCAGSATQGRCFSQVERSREFHLLGLGTGKGRT